MASRSRHSQRRNVKQLLKVNLKINILSCFTQKPNVRSKQIQQGKTKCVAIGKKVDEIKFQTLSIYLFFLVLLFLLLFHLRKGLWNNLVKIKELEKHIS